MLLSPEGPPKKRSPSPYSVKEALWKDSYTPEARSIHKGRYRPPPDPDDVAGGWSNASPLSHQIDPREKETQIVESYEGDPRYKQYPARPKRPAGKMNLAAMEAGDRLHRQVTESAMLRRKAREDEIDVPTDYYCFNAHSRRGLDAEDDAFGWGRGQESPTRGKALALGYRDNERGGYGQHQLAKVAEAGNLSPLQAAVLKALKGVDPSSPAEEAGGGTKAKRKPPLAQSQPPPGRSSQRKAGGALRRTARGGK